MNKFIRALMTKHKLPASIMTLYGLEIERIAEDYAQEQVKLVSSSFEEEVNKLAFEKYPIRMGSIGDEPDWGMNEQYRECWIDGYLDFFNNSKNR